MSMRGLRLAGRWGGFLAVLLVAARALARVGGGEHYEVPDVSSDGGDGDGGIPIEVIYLLVRLTFEHPKVMCPLLVVGGIVYFAYSRRRSPTVRTKKAFEAREAERRTAIGAEHVRGWVNALKLKDPGFELLALQDRVRDLFVRTQTAWFRRDLSPIRQFLSDATFQRLQVQLELMRQQGVRDAIADPEVLDVQLIGLDQSEWFDSVHLRVRAQMRDVDAPAEATDDQALALARRAAPEPFTEVWTFVRKPGVKTKVGEDLYQGKCPNCGAPYRGGATSTCEYCNAVVNSGNYDWTLSEITQGIEHVRLFTMVDGLLDARKTDPALNLEMLEDRASLLFWRWIDAQSHADPKRLAKVANPDFLQRLEVQLSELRTQGRKKVFLECAVGAVTTRQLRAGDGVDEAHVEIRWSARMGIGPANEKPPALPTVPQRWVFTLVRKAGAKTSTQNGMSTFRCGQCNAPLSDSASSTCDYCGAELAHGERDWVLQDAAPYERWDAIEARRYDAALTRQKLGAAARADTLPDVQERERLLYMMAALAAADGAVDDKERKLLELCSDRWGVPWSNVEMALTAGPQVFDRLVPKGSPEAEVFLRTLVQLALVDGKIDRQERQMLTAAAGHLGVPEQLKGLLASR